jgi:hypothetical protein
MSANQNAVLKQSLDQWTKLDDSLSEMLDQVKSLKLKHSEVSNNILDEMKRNGINELVHNGFTFKIKKETKPRPLNNLTIKNALKSHLNSENEAGIVLEKMMNSRESKMKESLVRNKKK